MDNNLVGLVHDMMDTLLFVAIVKDRTRTERLKLIVREMMELMNSTSHFIVDYFSHGCFGMCSAR
jgi:hypothetical protein